MNSENIYTPSIKQLITEFNKLPGIGKRSAERLAFHILSTTREEAMGLAVAIRDARKNLSACKICFNIAEGEVCAICSDKNRKNEVICVVELPRDIIALEKTNSYQGLYHVLQGRLSNTEATGPDNLRIKELMIRLENYQKKKQPIKEIIIATRPNVEGDVTAEYLASALKNKQIKITRLARGLASGSDLETVPASTLFFAFQARQEI